MPQEEQDSRAPPKNNSAQLRDTLLPLFMKWKSERKSSPLHGRKNIEIDQRVVAFLDDNRVVRGCVRYIGKGRSGNILTLVGLELVGNFYVCVFFVSRNAGSDENGRFDEISSN